MPTVLLEILTRSLLICFIYAIHKAVIGGLIENENTKRRIRWIITVMTFIMISDWLLVGIAIELYFILIILMILIGGLTKLFIGDAISLIPVSNYSDINDLIDTIYRTSICFRICDWFSQYNIIIILSTFASIVIYMCIELMCSHNEHDEHEE